MKKKKFQDEVLIKFPNTSNTRELDEMLNKFENQMNEFTGKYYLKESESPYIYFLEYSQPEKLIKSIEDINELSDISLTPVNCVMNNINYITSIILEKIKHKTTATDTFDVNCYIDGYSALYSQRELEEIIVDTLKHAMHIELSANDPMWKINVYIVGDVSAINITRSTRNRNKFSQYNNPQFT